MVTSPLHHTRQIRVPFVGSCRGVIRTIKAPVDEMHWQRVHWGAIRPRTPEHIENARATDAHVTVGGGPSGAVVSVDVGRVVATLIYGLFGLCVGSFLNVVIWRVPLSQGLVLFTGPTGSGK